MHWTRHPSRLDGDFGRKRHGDEGYAREELVAELGAACLPADLDLTPEVREEHAAYIASWIQVLKDDKRAIFSAALHAQGAADFLHGYGTRRRMKSPPRPTPPKRAVNLRDTLLVDGQGFSWQRLREFRRQQIGAWKAAQASQCSN